MEKEEYKKMYQLEATHWFFKGKRTIVLSILDKFFGKSRDRKILDVGCGTGILMKTLEPYGEVYGIDLVPKAVEFCKERGLNNVTVGDAVHLPYDDESFDIVMCIDMLYHKGIRDDGMVIKELYRVCKKGGGIIFTDSACPALWGKHDIAVHARERYVPRKFARKIEEAGFSVKKLSYYNSFLFPVVFTVRKLDNIFFPKRKPKSDVKETNPIINSILYSILSLEATIIKRSGFPIGVSFICVGKKLN